MSALGRLLRSGTMSRQFREIHTLDKDLERISAAERAGVQSLRALTRTGIAVLFVAVMVVVAAGMAARGGTAALGNHVGVATVAAGMALAIYFALTIGANDVSNSLSPAVGSGAIGLRAGLALVAVAEIAGAVLAGERVSATLSLRIVNSAQLLADGQAAPAMLAALLAAAIWMNLATWAGAPVSTTHSIVGGIAGAGVAVYGLSAVNWGGVAVIALGWIASPVAAALVAAGLLALVRERIGMAADRAAAARRWLPAMVAALTALAAGMLIGGPLGQGKAVSLVLMLAIGAAVRVAALAHLNRRIAAAALIGAEPRQRDLFAVPLVLAAVLMAFAHGANDASNVTAPLGLILAAAGQAGGAPAGSALQPIATLAAGGGLALGGLLFGRRLVVMVGSRITRLNPVRAFCVSLGTSAVVIGASWLGLPVSTTHVAVGGVFGVGFYREWEDRRRKRDRKALPVEETRRRTLVRRAHVRRILFAWAITLPASASLAALFGTMMR